MQPSIGILAGMGPRSTAPFVDLVVSECQRQYGARDDIDFPQMMICSQPAPFYEDRPIDHQALEAAIREGLQHLESTGVDFLAIACNTAHIYYPSLARSVAVPLLDMVELTVNATPRAGGVAALVAAQPTVEAGIYQTALRHRGWTIAEPNWQPQVNRLLGASRTSTDPALFGRLWKDITGRIEAAGADTIVVACLDLSGLIGQARSVLPIVDAAQCLASEIVRQWLLRRTFYSRQASGLPQGMVTSSGGGA